LRVSSISRLVKCEYCEGEFNLDKEDFASVQITDNLGKVKRRSYAHIKCHDRNLLAGEYAKYVKEQSANI